MRTRRSPRNQDILWRELGRQGVVPEKPVAIQASPRCWDCANYPAGGRVRGHCGVTGLVVAGRTPDKWCFVARGGR